MSRQSMMLMFAIVLAVSMVSIQAFRSSRWMSRPMPFLKATWQEQFDQFVDIDTPNGDRLNLASSLVRSLDSIASDVMSAIQTKDVEKVAPTNLTYGKHIQNAQAFRKQLTSDILPDLVTNQLPKVISEAPSIAKKVREGGSTIVKKQGEELIKYAQDVVKNPSLLQSTLGDVTKEVRNIFKTVPEGLQSPGYAVLLSTPSYEIRKYDSYSLASTPLSFAGSGDESDIISVGSSLTSLAAYFLGGENEQSSVLSMATPVVTGGGNIGVLLPDGLTAVSAPKPSSGKIVLEDVVGEVVAVASFPGVATVKEVARQRALLEDALLADGIIYDNLSFKTLTYNPPYTLPWHRRNEVSLRIEYPVPPAIPVSDE